MGLRGLTLFLFLVTFVSALPGQKNAYAHQVAVIENMLSAGDYTAAKRQSQALLDAGIEAKLPLVEAEAHRLLGRALTDNEAAGAKDRVAGIRQLRLAAQLSPGV